MTRDERNKKKTLSIIGTIASALLFLIVLSVFLLAVQAKRENRPLNIFGYSVSVVATPSMEPEIKAGDMIIVKESAKVSDVKLYDNIVFIEMSGEIAGERVVHKVVDITVQDGELSFTTRGVNNGADDDDKVTKDNFVGIEVYHSTFWGAFFRFFSRVENWIFMFVFIAAATFAVKQAKAIISYIKKKPDKTDEESR